MTVAPASNFAWRNGVAAVARANVGDVAHVAPASSFARRADVGAVSRAGVTDVATVAPASNFAWRADVGAVSRAVFVAVVAAVVVGSSVARADEGPLSLRYDVNAKEVTQGETFQIDVVLTVHTQDTVEELALPDFPRGLTVVQERKSSSTQINLVNGRQAVSVEQRFMYLLRADEAGTFKIPEATAKLGKSVARAAPVSIKVVAGNEAAASAEPASSVAGAPFGKNPPGAFLEVTVDHESSYVGQQITATTEVYSEQPLAQWPRLPSLKPQGFLCTALLGDERPNPSQRSVGGHLYYVYLVNKDALFPVSDGDLVIPGQNLALAPAGSFFSHPRDVNVKSLPIKLKVKPLPADDRPARFAPGNVGVWQLSASVRPSMNVSLDQPLTLSIVATGTGSLEQLQMPTWDGGDAGSARVFPSTSKIERRDITADAPELGGRVIEEMLVQPTAEGALRIPAFSLSYFDPYSGAYKTSSTQPIVVNVRAAHAAAGSSSSSGARQTIAKGARPLRTHASAQARPGEASVVAGVVAFLAGLALFVRGTLRRRHSASHAGKRAELVDQRKRALDDAKARGDLAALERVLLDALADRCGPDVKARALSDLAPLLQERGLERALVDDVLALVREMEAARYAPGGGERARLADRCVALVARVEAA